MPSVLHVSQPADGGVARYVAAAASDQVTRGWPVTVAAPAAFDAPGIEHVPWEAGRSPGPGCLPELRRLREIVDRVDPDVVHLHSAKAGLVGRLAVRGRRPTIFQPHGWSWLACRGPMVRAAAAWERAAARWCDAVVCVGEGEAELGREKGITGELVVVRNGVDLDWFHPADEEARERARRGFGLPGNAPLAVCVGRVTRQKGQDVLLRAWQQVRRECPAALLAIVGDGDMRHDLERLAVPGAGFYPPVGDVRPWYAAADVVVLPSRWEGLPLTVLEALASGRPVVATAVPGLAEVVTPDVGALVPAEAVEALAAELAVRLAQPQIAWAEGQAAAIRAKEFHAGTAFDRLAALTARVAELSPRITHRGY
ncbi:glycosyltransferase [Thermoactinospora rubra]|uniref:glycosyltransferase n=1 Tax=Thermoactinospora rubra TaxID=1088767 RepID=UPI000A0F6DC4|nr:glycosyltransferase [Thermoactinospora rubra]